MADFDLTQTDAQVQSILNDAQDAQGAGAQTSLTTDYIMLKGTNGRYHKIQKNSFTEAVRNVLAGLLVNNDKGTTISHVAAIASGDFGSVTPANLASILGALGNHTKYKGTAKLEDYKNVSCSFNIGTSELQDATNWTDFPSDGRVFSYFINLNFGGDSCIQLLFNEKTATGGIYYRNFNAGSYGMKPWRKVQVTV